VGLDTAEMMELALRELGGAVALVDPTDTVLWESPSCELLLGMKLADVTAEEFIRRCHVDDVATGGASMLRGAGEMRWWVNDTWRWVRLSRVGTVGENAVIVLSDATAAHALVERADALSSLLDASVELGRDGAVVADSLGMTPQDREVFADAVAAVGETGLVKANRRLWRAKVRWMTTGAIVGLRDMSDVDRSLRRVWRSVIESLVEGFWLLDENDYVLECNTAGLTMLGMTRDMAVGRPFVDVAPRLSESSKPVQSVTVTTGGRVMHLECSRSPVPLSADTTGVVLVVRDATREVDLAKALSLERRTLRELNEELRAVVAAIANTRGRERAAIARRLHDDPIQRLAALRWRLAGADPEAVSELEECYEALRQVVFDLRPQALAERGLVAALREMENLDDRVEVVAAGVDGVDADTAELVWRNVREAVRNAIAHSGASSIEVTVQRDGVAVVCEVKDNGCGVTPEGLRLAERRGHIGVASVRETVTEAGGRFHVVGLNTGTTMHMEVPGRWATG